MVMSIQPVIWVDLVLYDVFYPPETLFTRVQVLTSRLSLMWSHQVSRLSRHPCTALPSWYQLFTAVEA
jgi:hypothetical protein